MCNAVQCACSALHLSSPLEVLIEKSETVSYIAGAHSSLFYFGVLKNIFEPILVRKFKQKERITLVLKSNGFLAPQSAYIAKMRPLL